MTDNTNNTEVTGDINLQTCSNMLTYLKEYL